MDGCSDDDWETDSSSYASEESIDHDQNDVELPEEVEEEEEVAVSRFDASATKLDFEFWEKLTQSARCEVVGVARTYALLCRQFGYEPTSMSDAWGLMLEDLCSVLHKSLAAGFHQRTGRALTFSHVFRFVLCIVAAGTYNETYTNYAKDKETNEEKSNHFMRFSGELPLDEFNAIVDEIDKAKRGTLRPGSEDPLLKEARDAVTNSFGRLLSYLEHEDTASSYALLGVDDLQSKGADGFRAGVAVHYNTKKATKLGIVNILGALCVTRIPIALVQLTLDGKERGETLSGLFRDAVLGAFNKHAPRVGVQRVLADFDRGMTSLLRSLARDGMLYVATLQKPGKRNKRNVFAVVAKEGDAPPSYYEEASHVLVAENGASVSHFAMPREGVTQVAQRTKNRLAFLETNVPELQGAVISLQTRAGHQSDEEEDLTKSDLLEKVVILTGLQRNRIWRILRKYIITSTVVLFLCRLDDKWKLNAELCGEEYRGVVGSIVCDDDLDEETVEHRGDNEIFPHASTARVEEARAHFAMLQQLRLQDVPRLSAALQAVAGARLENARAVDLVKAAKALKLALPQGVTVRSAAALKPAQLHSLRQSVEDARVQYNLEDATEALFALAEQHFPGNRATKSGVLLEATVRAGVSAFVEEATKSICTMGVFDLPGLYESKGTPYLLTSPDGGIVFQHGDEDPVTGILEIKCIEDSSLLAKIAAQNKMFLEVRVSTDMNEEDIAALKVAVPEHLDHLPQVIHHAAVFDVECVAYVSADTHMGGRIVRVVVFTVDDDMRRRHVSAFDLVGRAYMPWVADEESATPFPDGVSEDDARAGLALRRALRKAAPIDGLLPGGKSAAANAHNLLKVSADVTHQDVLRVRYNCGPRGPKINQIVDLVHIGTIAAARVFAAHQHVASTTGLGASVTHAKLGNLKQIRRAMNRVIGQGGLRQFLRSAVRHTDVTRYAGVRTAVIAQQPLLVAPSVPLDPHWRPLDKAYWADARALRDAVARGAGQAAAFYSNPTLSAFRRHTYEAEGHQHKAVPIQSRQRCVLDCEGCVKGKQEHTRRGCTVTKRCSNCGVALSLVPRAYFARPGGPPRSAWHVFHEDMELPKHPYATAGGATVEPEPAVSSAAAASAASGSQAPQRTDSSRKRRSAALFLVEEERVTGVKRKLNFRASGAAKTPKGEMSS